MVRNEGNGHGGQGLVTHRGDFILVGIFRLVYCWLCLVAKKVQEYTRKLKKLRIFFIKNCFLFFFKLIFR